MSDAATPPKALGREHTRSQAEFLKAREPVKELIREVLKEEREVAHMRRRSSIHQNILVHVKQIIP